MKIVCSICGKEFSKYGIKNHISVTHEGKIHYVNHGGMKGKRGWSKGKTKFDDARLKKLSEKLSKYRKGKVGAKHSDETKKKISEAMKRAHHEGRAWNIGKSRWNNEPSYPEQFIMNAINLNLINQDYIREHPIGIYSIDFAWVNDKLAVEIDGEQHERFLEYKLRDLKKDKLLKELDWKVLRLKWKDIYHHPRENIKKLKEFIDYNS